MNNVNWKRLVESDERLDVLWGREGNLVVSPAERPEVGALVAGQHRNGLFPVSKKCFRYIKKALREGRLDEGYVLLLRDSPSGKPEFVNAFSIAEFEAKTKLASPVN